MGKLKKGSAAAKAHMAKLRAMIGKKRKTYKSTSKTVKQKAKKVGKRRSYRKKRRRRRKQKIPILPTLATSNYLLKVATAGGKLNALQSGNMQGYMEWVMKDALLYGTGYNLQTKRWSFGDFMQGTGLIIMSSIGSKIMTKLGVNRHISRIPMIGKHIKL